VEATLTGPGIWFINIVGVVSLVMALFVSVDVWRPARAERLESDRSKVLWAGPQLLYVVALAATIIPGVLPGEYRWIVLALAPVAVILQVSYLLRVVYPKSEDGPSGKDRNAKPRSQIDRADS
jgi:hypothetical protein